MRNDELISTLNSFISNGNELSRRNVKTQNELYQLEKDYVDWRATVIRFLTDNLDDSFASHINDFQNKEAAQTHNSIFGIKTHPAQTPEISKLDKLGKDIVIKNKILHEIKELINASPKSNILSPQIDPNEKPIFIVHGHNVEYKSTLQHTLSRLELKAIILADLASSGDTLIEKLEKHSNVGFAIVILTGDDEGRKRGVDAELKPRARQNVILELGYFIGKLGRKRVMCLYASGVEKPSDYEGVSYTLLDAHGSWVFDLVKELKAAGYNVDANKLL